MPSNICASTPAPILAPQPAQDAISVNLILLLIVITLYVEL
ncbi:hypothetical protein HMPREF0080_01780 [Anaeroglobus geminatus F0357]|uniref:Uncharacterized protein n=1 Tax=Anaeroglobus geminatus F0357 TaxID=861450 RepID=G9YJD0_9FIRM|nr:hypothetical protein HMPREF0080_01780 [Anaeroglobus geminatus F0357]